jgi:hypothetical protein
MHQNVPAKGPYHSPWPRLMAFSIAVEALRRVRISKWCSEALAFRALTHRRGYGTRG